MSSSRMITGVPEHAPRDSNGAEFGRGLKTSLIVHFSLLAILILKSLVFPDQSTPYIPSLRVDVVGLPDVLKQDLKKIPSTPASEAMEQLKDAEKSAESVDPKPVKQTAEKADPDELVLKPKAEKNTSKNSKTREKQMKSAIARMKALAKISSDDSHPTGVLVKGNQISKGTSLTGDARENAQAGYYDLVRERLHDNWELPIWIARQNLSAQIEITIDSYGKVRTFRFTKLSGNPQFDEAVKRTVAQSQPFPAPPKEISAHVLTHGISVGFPL